MIIDKQIAWYSTFGRLVQLHYCSTTFISLVIDALDMALSFIWLLNEFRWVWFPACSSNCKECANNKGSMECSKCEDAYALDSKKTCVSKYMLLPNNEISLLWRLTLSNEMIFVLCRVSLKLCEVHLKFCWCQVFRMQSWIFTEWRL